MKSKKLTDNETNLIKAALPEKYRCIFTLGVQTGLRVSEMLSLRRYNLIDSLGNIRPRLTVERKHVKGKGASRNIPLSQESIEALSLHLKTIQGDRVFQFTRKCYNEALKKAATKVGVEPQGISSHTTRKTFAHKVYSKSEKDIHLTARALGHKSIAATIHYLSVGEEQLDKIFLDAS